MKTMTENRFISTVEAAEICRVTPKTIKESCANGIIKSLKVGRYHAILLNDLYEHCGTDDPMSYQSTREIFDLFKLGDVVPKACDAFRNWGIRNYTFGRIVRWNPSDVEKNAAKIKNIFGKQLDNPSPNNSSLFDSNNSRSALYKKLERLPDAEYAKISSLIDLISQGKIQVESIASGLWLCKLKSAATPPTNT